MRSRAAMIAEPHSSEKPARHEVFRGRRARREHDSHGCQSSTMHTPRRFVAHICFHIRTEVTHA